MSSLVVKSSAASLAFLVYCILFGGPLALCCVVVYLRVARTSLASGRAHTKLPSQEGSLPSGGRCSYLPGLELGGFDITR